MTQTVHVGSKSQSMVIVEVEARGLDQMAIRQAAIQFARARHRISDPIALSEHEAAVRMRRQFVAQFAPKMPNISRRSPMNFDEKYPTRH